MQTLLSVVIPLLNEEESLHELYARLKNSLEGIVEPTQDTFEILFVDDGSTDHTYRILTELTRIDSRVRAIRLTKRYGKTAALAAAFRVASGQFLVTMDGDLQHQPEDLPLFMEKLRHGYDVVCGKRRKRVDNFWLRRLPSKIANKAMRRLSGVPIDDFGGGYKAYRMEVLRRIKVYGGMQRFIPALASAVGASICEVEIENIPRRYGVSRYGISRVVPVFFDLLRIHFLLRYISQPLRYFGGFGLAMLSAGALFALWLLGEWLFTSVSIAHEHGPILVMSAVLLVTGLQLLLMGLIGELVLWLHNQSNDHAEYIVAEATGFESPELV